MKNQFFKVSIAVMMMGFALSASAETTMSANSVTDKYTIPMTSKAAPLVASQTAATKTPRSDPQDKKLLKIQIRDAVGGGIHGGGGVTVADQDGKRRLLDLMEKDELEYFSPDRELMDSDFRCEKIFKGEVCSNWSQFTENLRQFTRYLVDSPQAKKEYDMYRRNLGEPEFLFTLMMAFDENYEIELQRNLPKPYVGMLPDVMSRYHVKIIEALHWAFVDIELEKISDEGQISYENEQTKRQVAIQKDGIVLVNRAEYKMLDRDSRAALFLHEAVLRTVLALNPDNIRKNGTRAVRAYTRQVFKKLKAMPYGSGPSLGIADAYKSLDIVEHSSWTRED